MKTHFRISSLLLFLLFLITSLPAQPPAGKGYVLIYDESFPGDTLNTNNWLYREGLRTGTGINGYNRKENVYVKDGMMHIAAKYEMVDGVYHNTGGGIMSKKDFGYGYYECLSKPFMAGTGVHSAFWQRGSNVSGSTIFEIDSYEIDSKSWLGCNNLYYYPSTAAYTEWPWPHRANIPFAFNSSGWFLDAYERTPEGVIFYDNGQVVARAEWDELNAGQMVWLTALNGVGTVDKTKLPGETLFKYFRFYAKDWPGYNLLPNGNFEYNQDKLAATKPACWIVSGANTDAATVIADTPFRDKYKLRIAKTSAYQTLLSQPISYITNGDYELTAMVRSSGGQKEAKIRVKDFGGNELVAEIPTSSVWQKITIPGVKVRNNQVQIEIAASGDAGQWIDIDDINFMKPLAAGQTAPEQKPFPLIGEPIWKLAEKEPVTFTGDTRFYFFSRNVGCGEAMSITFTVNAALKANMTPIARIPSTGNSGWAVQLNEDGSLTFRIGSVANHSDITIPSVYEVGKAVKVTCVFNKGTVFMFVNDVLKRKVTGITQLTNDATAAGRLGSVGAAYQAVGEVVLPDSSVVNTNTTMKNFQGTIQNLRIYNIPILGDESTDYIKNGDFEITTAGQTNWLNERVGVNSTAFTWLKTNPAEKLVSMRVIAVNSTNPYGAALAQKISVPAGQYLLRFLARSSATTDATNKFTFKLTNFDNGTSIVLNDTTTKWVRPSSAWQRYSYKINLKEDFTSKISFGFGSVGTFDIDSISLVRTGNVATGLQCAMNDDDSRIKVNGKTLRISNENATQLNLFGVDGKLIFSRQLPVGMVDIDLNRSGLFIVQLQSKTDIFSKKIWLE